MTNTNLVEKQWWDDDAPPTPYVFLVDVEWEYEPYQFDKTRVWRHAKTGELFYATDSGCSCPTPFERTTVDKLVPIRRIQDWHDHVASKIVEPDPDNEYQYPIPTPQRSKDAAETARRAISEALKNNKEN